MRAFNLNDLVKVTQTGSAPKPGFITSTDGTSYTIEYFDNTTEEGVAHTRLQKGIYLTAKGRPAFVTDRRFKDNKRDDYRLSVQYTDEHRNNLGEDRKIRYDLVEIEDMGPAAQGATKGGRTRRSRKSKSKSRRRR